MKKLFIFEGPDFSGKTTQIKLLEEKLIALGKKVKVTREPGGTPIGEAIREMLLKRDVNISKETEAYLFAASRRAHNELIAKWIEEGYIVLCDRHLLSSLVFQKDKSTSFLSKDINDINRVAMLPIRTSIRCSCDLLYKIIYFDLSLDTFKARRKERLKKEDIDNIEKRYISNEDINHMLELYKTTACDCCATFVDANKSIEELHAEIIELL